MGEIKSVSRLAAINRGYTKMYYCRQVHSICNACTTKKVHSSASTYSTAVQSEYKLSIGCSC